jgi:hypothetical protein
MRALGELMFPLVLADSGGDIATVGPSLGRPPVPALHPLTPKTLTGLLAQPAGARAVAQAAGPVARDIAIAGDVSRSMVPQRCHCWQPASGQLPVPAESAIARLHLN